MVKQSELKYLKPSDVKLNPDNPRLIKDDKFKKLVKSIKEFPEMTTIRPIIVDEDMVILGGNMRYRAMVEAGIKKIPVVVVEGLTPEKKREFVIKDNSSFGEWNWDELANSFSTEELSDWGVDVALNIEDEAEEEDELRDEFTVVDTVVQYEPSDRKHSVSDLYSVARDFTEIIDNVKNEEMRNLLRIRAMCFVDFKYAKIADYYANQATNEEKIAFEALGMILLDKNNLIKNGFAKIYEDYEREAAEAAAEQ